MRKLLALVILAATVITAVPAAAPASSAGGAQEFLRRQHPFDDFWGWHTATEGNPGDHDLLSIGYWICARKNWNVDDLMRAAISYAPPAGSIARQRFLERRNDALQLICPT